MSEGGGLNARNATRAEPSTPHLGVGRATVAAGLVLGGLPCLWIFRGDGYDLSLGSLMTAIGAFGAVVSYFMEQKLSRAQESRQRELELIERRLRDLYGPLYAISSSSKEIYKAYKLQAALVMDSGILEPNTFALGKATPALVRCHRSWMQRINVPQWDDIEVRIRTGGDLVIESEFPDEFRQILTHIAGWRVLIESWEGTDVNDPSESTESRNFAQIPFPVSYRTYVSRNYGLLRKRQMELLTELHPSGVAADYMRGLGIAAL